MSARVSIRAHWGALLLLILGLVRMGADLTGARKLAGVAAATGAAPAPRVFSAVQGLETFSSRFTISWSAPSGDSVVMDLTPARYSRVRGPYNRRNVYGAVVAYGPVLVSDPGTKPLFHSVARSALCGERPLLAELGADPEMITDPVVLHVQPMHEVPKRLPLELIAPCQ